MEHTAAVVLVAQCAHVAHVAQYRWATAATVSKYQPSTLESTDKPRSKPQPLLHTCIAHIASLQVLQAPAIMVCHTLPHHMMLHPVSTRGVQQRTQQAQAPHQAHLPSWRQPIAAGMCVPVGWVQVPPKPEVQPKPPSPRAWYPDICLPPPPSRHSRLKAASQNKHTPMPQNVKYRLAADQLIDLRRYKAAAAGRKLQLPSCNTQSASMSFRGDTRQTHTTPAAMM